MNEEIVIRLEREKDHRAVEELIREAFWNVYCPGCSEHYVVHALRSDEAFVKGLSFVLEVDGKLVGYIMYMRAVIKEKDESVPVLTMGPIGILSEFRHRGYGKLLVEYTLRRAASMGFGAVLIEGNYDFYSKCGFTYAREFGIRYHDLPEGMDDSFFLAIELQKGYLKNVDGVYQTPEGYFVSPEDVEAFDVGFPPKEKLKLDGQIF